MNDAAVLFAQMSFWRDDFFQQLFSFVLLTLRGLGLGLLISIPLGIVLSRIPRLSTPVISVLALVQTVPSLAFIGFCISLLAIADGDSIAIICAVVYSVFPIVLNTHTGILQVDPKIKDAARGMGLTNLQILWQVELPLALPVIMAGVSTGAVYAIGMITICAIAGAGGLGNYVTVGISRGDVSLTLFGVAAILLLTVMVLLGLSRLSELSKKRGNLGLTVFAAIIVALAAYGIMQPGLNVLVSAIVRSWQESASFQAFWLETRPLYWPIPCLMFLALVVRWGLKRRSELVKNYGSIWFAVFGVLIIVAGFFVLLDAYAAVEPAVSAQFREQIPDGQLQTELKQRTLYDTWKDSNDFWRQTRLFVSLTIRGLGMALLFGLPLGIVLSRFPRAASPVITATAMVQTVPSLALLGLCAAVFGLFGAEATVFATIVYSLLPIVLNTFTGITQVDPRVRDAARGMGMNTLQILWKVELPLALPVIMAGVRTAATYSIIMVTVGVLVGARGLGGYIMDGITQKDNPLILVGIIPILFLSLLVFFGLSAIAWLSRKRASLGQMVGTVLIVTMSFFAVVEPFLRPKSDIRIGCKEFAENLILGHIFKIMLETHTDLTVDLIPNLGSNFAYKSLLAENIDIYPEYTGTLLTNPDALNVQVPLKQNTVITGVVKKEIERLNIKVPPDEDPVTEFVRQQTRKRFGLELLQTLGLNNGYAVAVRDEAAKDLQLKTIGDLNKNPDFRIVVSTDFVERPDGWEGMTDIFKLKHKTPETVNPSLMYNKIEQGQADVIIGFSTDWQLSVYPLKVLKDDKGYFPNYHAAPLVSEQILKKYPRIAEVLNLLKNQIGDDAIQQLNREVIVQKRKAGVVAREFLQRKGLLEVKSSRR